MSTKTAISREQVLQSEELILEAIKSSDVETIDRLLHDDLTFIAPDGTIVTKKMDLDAHRAGQMVVEELTSVTETISLFEDTAVSVSTIFGKGVMLGEPVEGRFRYARVWKAYDGICKVIGGSCTAL